MVTSKKGEGVRKKHSHHIVVVLIGWHQHFKGGNGAMSRLQKKEKYGTKPRYEDTNENTSFSVLLVDNLLRNVAHSKDVNVKRVTSLLGRWHFINLLFVHLEHVHHHSMSTPQPFMTHHTFEVLGALVLNQYLLCLECAVAIITEYDWLD